MCAALIQARYSNGLNGCSVEYRCHCCQLSAVLRSHVVWFGKMLLGMDEIYQAVANDDFFIAIVTSLAMSIRRQSLGRRNGWRGLAL